MISNRYIFALLLLLGFYTQEVEGQIFPPEFDCLLSDTLFWQTTPNSCGPFQSTEIYFSNNPAGPFTLLTSINDPLIEQFYHMNNTGEDRYYYLRHIHDCPGEAILNTDTLSNQPVVDAVITFISVESGQISVNWDFSPSPQVVGYIIYRITDLGSVPIDTVDAFTNSYLDIDAMPLNASVGYFVVAIDPCENTSNFNNQHATILLQGGASDCDEEISIDWSSYVGWMDQVSSYDIYVSAAGVTPQKVGSVSGTENNYLVEGISSGIEYCIYVEAVHSNNSLASKSNVFCVTPDIVDKVDVLQLENVSVRPDNTIELTWFWETNIEINSFEFRSGIDKNQLSTSFSGLPGIIIGNTTTRIDPAADGSIGKIFYNITTIDDCGREFSSNIGSTIFLSGAPAEVPLQNQLNWTALDIEGASLSEYHLGILMPNAFSPAGINNQFKPLILFDEGIDFNMKIYNRWGALIFETDNYLQGWDGRIGLKEMPLGGYLYAVQVIQPDGEIQTKEGSFLLIR